MTVASAATPGKTEVSSVRTEQIYVTYCDQSDSLRKQPGFHVRASSTADMDLLKLASEYLGYELPLDLWGTDVKPECAPRRLARLQGPGGRPVLLHSAHLPAKAGGRGGNYFTHVLCRDRLTVCQALQTWASAEWLMEYAPGASKLLPSREDLPHGGNITDQTLTAFLSEANPPADQDLASVIWPHRLGSDPRQRQELLRQMLLGCALVLQAGEGTARGRFYIFAEPGLTALLLYGAARLLPSALVADLTFSTYESLHALRQFRSAQVVATFTANPQKGLDAEYYTSRGYALDTFKATCSSELQGGKVSVLDELVGLAAQGDWNGVEELHRLCRSERNQLAALEKAAAVRNAFRRLRGPQPRPEDLLSLHSSPEGLALLDQHAADIWPLVRDWSLTHEEIRRAFRELLRKHLGELRNRAARSARRVTGGPTGTWSSSCVESKRLRPASSSWRF